MSALDSWPEPARRAIFNALLRGRIAGIVSGIDSTLKCLASPRTDEEREVVRRLELARRDLGALELRLDVRPSEVPR